MEDFHPSPEKNYFTKCFGSSKVEMDESAFELDFAMTIGALEGFGIKSLHFKCEKYVEDDTIASHSDEKQPQTKSAFDVLMGASKKRSLPDLKESR